MKKFITLFMGLCIVMAITACGGNDAKAVYDKIEKNETLTTSDYNTMLDYGTDCLDALSKAIEKGDVKKIENIENEYPYFETFMDELQKADDKDVDKQKLSQLFTKAIGVAMQMQSSGLNVDF